MHIDVRQATTADIATVSSILLEAAKWLEDRGTPMWRDSELTPARIASDVTDGLLFLGEDSGEPISTIKFQLSDQEFWPDVPEGESAFARSTSDLASRITAIARLGRTLSLDTN
jgi:hypothetical protein